MTESAEFVRLVGRCRQTCLWFVDPAALPADREGQLMFLGWIERHGDRDDFIAARKLKAWLSQNSSAAFSVS